MLYFPHGLNSILVMLTRIFYFEFRLTSLSGHISCFGFRCRNLLFQKCQLLINFIKFINFFLQVILFYIYLTLYIIYQLFPFFLDEALCEWFTSFCCWCNVWGLRYVMNLFWRYRLALVPIWLHYFRKLQLIWVFKINLFNFFIVEIKKFFKYRLLHVLFLIKEL